MLLFPKYVIELENDEYPFLQPEHSRYYRDCILAANEFLTRPENAEFMKWVRHHGKVHVALKGTTDYTYSGLLYQMFEYEPFRSILGTCLLYTSCLPWPDWSNRCACTHAA